MKLSESETRILVGADAPLRPDLAGSIAVLSGKIVETVLLDPAELASYLAGRAVDAPTGALSAGGDERILLDRLANDAPVVNLVNSILIDAIRADASDVHVEAGAEESTVRYRIDGSLTVARRFSRERFAGVSARIKVMANLNVMERRLPQDGRVTVDLGNDTIDLRVSIVPVRKGESIVLRILGRSKTPLSLESLGMDASMLATTERLLRSPHGLVLVTGPTGSGKTTTLTAMLRALRDETRKVISIEDPIEYVVDGVNQIQTNEKIQLTFESILRRVLRQDPDVVMVGEVRDHPTADLVVRAAMTGHLVLTTLHTNDAVAAIARMKNIGVEPYLTASVLRASIAQRLLRRVCPACAGSRPLGPAERAIASGHGLELDRTPVAIGCPACRGTGYSGRFAVFESFSMDTELEELVASGGRGATLATFLEERGMPRLARAALSRVAEGETTFEEFEREVGA
ncbi:MAG: type II/IV secretion system protein [Spirochaetales bacterium]|nr:type II/IV secretion system protein [Spirochaetales bacterium]